MINLGLWTNEDINIFRDTTKIFWNQVVRRHQGILSDLAGLVSKVMNTYFLGIFHGNNLSDENY